MEGDSEPVLPLSVDAEEATQEPILRRRARSPERAYRGPVRGRSYSAKAGA